MATVTMKQIKESAKKSNPGWNRQKSLSKKAFDKIKDDCILPSNGSLPRTSPNLIEKEHREPIALGQQGFYASRSINMRNNDEVPEND